jgi:hypothetical protein
MVILIRNGARGAARPAGRLPQGLTPSGIVFFGAALV